MKQLVHTSILRNLYSRDAFAFDPLTGMQLVPRDPWICFAENENEDEDDKGGGGKTYTKDDIERIVKQRLKKAEAENAKLAANAEKAAKDLEALSAKFAKLEEAHEASGKSEIEKELAKTQRALAKLEAEKADAVKAATEAAALAAQATAGLKTTKLEAMLREGLRSSKAHGQGLDQAVRLMLAEGATLDDEGAFTMKLGEVPYDKPADAAKKWLEANSHFAEGTAGGAGTRIGGSNGKLHTPAELDAMPTTSLIATGLKGPVAPNG